MDPVTCLKPSQMTTVFHGFKRGWMAFIQAAVSDIHSESIVIADGASSTGTHNVAPSSTETDNVTSVLSHAIMFTAAESQIHCTDTDLHLCILSMTNTYSNDLPEKAKYKMRFSSLQILRTNVDYIASNCL